MTEQTKVSVIDTVGDNHLIQWLDPQEGYKRAWVPKEDVTGFTPGLREGYCANPDRGIAYGDPLEDVGDHLIDSAAIAFALRRGGIWTWDQILANPAQVQGVFHKLSDRIYGAVLSTARVQRRQEDA